MMRLARGVKCDGLGNKGLVAEADRLVPKDDDWPSNPASARCPNPAPEVRSH